MKFITIEEHKALDAKLLHAEQLKDKKSYWFVDDMHPENTALVTFHKPDFLEVLVVHKDWKGFKDQNDFLKQRVEKATDWDTVDEIGSFLPAETEFPYSCKPVMNGYKLKLLSKKDFVEFFKFAAELAN